ncbi:MAG: membrane protein insertase YidC [Myxococcota bacterium]
MDQQKRMLLALALSFALTFVYITFFAPKPEPTAEGGSVADAGVAQVVDAGAPAPVVAPSEPAGAPPPELPPVEQVKRSRAEVHYVFSTEGAGLTQAELQGPKMREVQRLTIAQGFKRIVGGEVPTPPQMDMAIPVPNQPLPLSLSIEGAQPLAANARYRVIPSPEQIVFQARQGPWEVTKRLQWAPDGFELAYTVELKNVSTTPASGELGLHYARTADPEAETPSSFFGGIGNQSRASCMVGDKLHHLVPGDEQRQEFSGPVRFIGVDQTYFLGTVFPLEEPREGRCVLEATPTARLAHVYSPVTLAPGETKNFRFGAYIGPKDAELLAVVPSAKAPTGGAAFHPGLEKTVDFGILEVICRVLLAVMKFFHHLAGNWGVAIILLTVAVKLILLPLTHKSMVSAEQMKKLQPRMEEIRKKFAEDRERQNLEIMKLYQEAKVNPLGGCLPMLFQLPVWAALFTTLRTSYELYREPFIAPLWTDLTYKDPIYFLPLALGVTMIVTQRLQPQMMDATQAKIMTYVMPVFFTFIMLNYPAGLTLYIFTNNLLSIAQQYALRKYLEKKGVAERGRKAEKKKSKSLVEER